MYDIANEIRIAREAKGWTQEMLAEKLDVSQQSVQKWEAGIAVPRAVRRVQLNRVLGITLEAGAAPRLAAATRATRNAPQETAERHRPGPDEIIEELTNLLPDEYKDGAGGKESVRGFKYRFTYLSKKVVATLLYQIEGAYNVSGLRVAAWRLMAMKHANRDEPHRLSSRHYLLMIVPRPGPVPDYFPDTTRLFRQFEEECHLFDLPILAPANLADAAKLIEQFENEPTEIEKFFQSAGDLPDLFDDDFA